MSTARHLVNTVSGFTLACLGFAHMQPIRAATAEVDTAYPKAYALYVDLHKHPELSGYETRTAAKLAGELRVLGYTVTEHVGGTGVVAILKNGRAGVRQQGACEGRCRTRGLRWAYVRA
jgi:hypothetical protein